jgi:hypothetical protein
MALQAIKESLNSDGLRESENVRCTDHSLHVDSSPYVVSVTPHDTNTYDPPLLGLRVGTTAGDIKVVSNGATVTIPAVAVGETVVGSITKVFATDTAAVGITGWQRSA